MKYASKKQVIEAAQKAGSSAKTFKGAAKFLANIRPWNPLEKRGVKEKRTTTRADYIYNNRGDRIVLALNMISFKYYSWSEAHRMGLYTKTQWNENGYALLLDAEPSAKFVGQYDTYNLYTRDAVRPKLVQNKIPAKQIDLLAAIFVVTRAAKRFRDAATSCFNFDAHSFAKAHRRKKEQCYKLKDKGIVAAVKEGRIEPVATSANLTAYCGEGYCYHSMLRPDSWTPPEMNKTDGLLRVEAKPKQAKEPRLKDAVATLEMLADDTEGFSVIPFPKRTQNYSRGTQSYYKFDRFDDFGDDDFDNDDCLDEDSGEYSLRPGPPQRIPGGVRGIR